MLPDPRPATKIPHVRSQELIKGYGSEFDFIPISLVYTHAPTSQLNSRKVMIASQVQDAFNNHNMVAIYHYNSLSTQEWNGIRYKLAQNGIRVKIFPSKLSMKALQETRYVHINPLFRGCTAIAFAKEPSAIKELLSVTNSESKLHLLGGVVEDIMMTPLGLQDYANLPTLKDLQQILLGTLNQTQMMLVRSLESTPQRLSQLLSQIASSSDTTAQ